MHDLRFALRSLAKSSGFTAVAVLTLALGIGFSTSSFSFVNAFLLRDVPYPDSGRLVRVYRTSREALRRPHAPANLLDIRNAATTFVDMAPYNEEEFALGEPGQPAELVQGLSVAPNFFAVLRVTPFLGRVFEPDEVEPGKCQVVVLAHRAWVRHYGSDPRVLGTRVRLNSQLYTVIGVLPAEFDAPLVWALAEFVVPRVVFPGYRTQRANAFLQCVGRLKSATSMRAAQADLDAIAVRLAREFPKENGNDGLRIVALHDAGIDGVDRPLLWLMTVLSLVMVVIACANLATLQVARALARSRDFAIRAALGGRCAQLMQPLLYESLILSVAGGALGLLVASWSNDIVGSLLRINGEVGFEIPIDGRVLAFAAASSLISALAFGLMPAWLASRTAAAEALKESSATTTGSAAHHALKRALIVIEVALTLGLIGAAASFGIGAKKFFHREVGWQVDGLFEGTITLPVERYPDNAHLREFQRTLLERLAGLPGVQHVSLSRRLPIYALSATRPVQVEGQPTAEVGREPMVEQVAVSADFFATLGIPLREGTYFSPDLKPENPSIAIVNESFARRFWPNASAVGRRFLAGEKEKWTQIVGVVGDVRMAVRPDAPETRMHVYQPAVQMPGRNFTVAVRATMPPAVLGPALRQIVANLDSDLPVMNVGLVRDETNRMLSNLNLMIINIGISAGMALLVAGVGLFGVVSQLAVQRTREIGVRIALGAQHRDIISLVLGEGLRLLALGLVFGIPGWFAGNVFLRHTITEAQIPGVWLLVVNCAVISAVMLVAAWLPAHRAARINPIEALRSE